MPCPKGWSLLCISFSCHLLLQQKYCKCNQSDVTKEETAGRSWGGFLSLQEKTWENSWAFQGRDRKQAEEQVSESSILLFWRIPAPTLAHLSFSFWSLTSSVSPLSLSNFFFSDGPNFKEISRSSSKIYCVNCQLFRAILQKVLHSLCYKKFTWL